MKIRFPFITILVLSACTQKQVEDASKIAVDIACAIENAELNDPAIAEACHLTQAEFDKYAAPALVSHRKGITKALARKGLKPVDAGCP